MSFNVSNSSLVFAHKIMQRKFHGSQYNLLTEREGAKMCIGILGERLLENLFALCKSQSYRYQVLYTGSLSIKYVRNPDPAVTLTIYPA